MNGRAPHVQGAVAPLRMRLVRLARWALLLLPVVQACDRAPDPSLDPSSALETVAVDPRCALPGAPSVRLDQEGAVLLSWEFVADSVLLSAALPDDAALLAYRAAMIADGADLRRPVVDPPQPANDEEAEIWRDEHYNTALVYDQDLGTIAPITCLDALVFALQANRVPPIEQPTEFLVSVLRRTVSDTLNLAVVFGAGSEMFPPRATYGFDVVEEYVEDGWAYWYALHNHTPQRNGDLLALGVPVPSTSDVALSRSLGQNYGLESARVTNGFYTFTGSMTDLEAFRTR